MTSADKDKIYNFLEYLYKFYNNKEYIYSDPIRFPHEIKRPYMLPYLSYTFFISFEYAATSSFV